MFKITAIVLVSVNSHYHINGLHLFWDTPSRKILQLLILCYNLFLNISIFLVHISVTENNICIHCKCKWHNHLSYIRESPRDVIIKVLDYIFKVREFELQSRYYINFQTNTFSYEPLYIPIMVQIVWKLTLALNNTRKWMCHKNNQISIQLRFNQWYEENRDIRTYLIEIRK